MPLLRIDNTLSQLGRLLILSALGLHPVQAEPLTPQEEAGKRIYTEGLDLEGRSVDARVGEADVVLPSSALPCAGCHGKLAEGGEEGGVRPPPLAWNHLTKHYGHVHDNARRHPAFDPSSFSRALRDGRDPAENRLDSTMPRYTWDDADILALMSYLKRISAESVQGVTDQTLRIGTLAPRSGGLAGAGDAMLAALQFHIDRMNERGGLFGRRIELVVADYEQDAGKTLTNLQRLLEEGDVFALISPFLVGIESAGAKLAARYRMPIVAPFSQSHGGRDTDLEYTFYLRSGFAEQAQASMTYHAGQSESAGNLLLIRPSGNLEGVAEALESAAQEHGWQLREVALEQARDAWGALVSAGLQNNERLVFFYGPRADLSGFMQAADELGWHPKITVPAALAGTEVFTLPVGFSDRLYLTHPDPAGRQYYRTTPILAAFLGSELHQPAYQELQLAALNAAQVLSECLKRSGHGLSRDKFLAALESLHAWDSDIGPKLSFGVNQRVAARGSKLLSVDIANHQYKLVSAWLALD